MTLDARKIFPPPIVREAEARRPYRHLQTSTIEFMRECAERKLDDLRVHKTQLEVLAEESLDLSGLLLIANRLDRVEKNSGRLNRISDELKRELMARQMRGVM
ncbi:MAG TPA: hypothetical protein PL033_10775 [Candidatus Brocadiia bacterium]|nr:hypothetical protein [Candidatus Brocadiia bacterium]